MNYKIKEEVAHALLNYLITRPYAEVHELVKALQSIEPIKEMTENKNQKNPNKKPNP